MSEDVPELENGRTRDNDHTGWPSTSRATDISAAQTEEIISI
jgi:hypothetical protein